MTFQEHEIFLKPDNENIKIWRYMDFSKFVNILNEESLFFARADKLGDPFEGTFSRANNLLRPVIYKEFDLPSDHLDNMVKGSSEFIKNIRKYTFVNCWHMNEFESDAMWKLYLKSGEGVAVQSTYTRLVTALDVSSSNIFIGKVRYIDYSSEWMPEGNTMYPIIHKQKSFEHEREMRAVIVNFPTTERESDFSIPTPDYGIYVAINPDELIEKVYLAPTSPEWLLKLTRGIIEKYGFKFQVLKSQLDEPPVYY